MAVKEILSVDEFSSCVNASTLIIVHFWATWMEACRHLNQVMDELSRQHSKIAFCTVEADKLEKVSVLQKITSVPTFVFFKDGKEIDRLIGANPSELTKKTQLLAATSTKTSDHGNASMPSEALNERLGKLIRSAPVMVFMKGTPSQPQCGFSRELITLLDDRKVVYSSFNILNDESVRQGLKVFSQWPTYPQVYIQGNLVGGLDIVKELLASGELDAMLSDANAVKADPAQDLHGLVRAAPIMLFMKGDADHPQCGFSATIVKLLQNYYPKYHFKTFDILKDERVRQELKTFSNWPTYPQLYVNGDLIGGLDIVKEMHEQGELETIFAQSIQS